MLADTNTTEKPDVEESYGCAVSASNLRVGNDSTIQTPGDIIAAAGMGRYRMGAALMRLATEWHSAATPKLAQAPTAKELRKSGVAFEVAQSEATLVAARLAQWHLAEYKLRFQRLKTLPAVRAELLRFVRQKGWDNEETLVSDTLRHFLSPVCPHCEGRGKMVVPGSSRAVGRECRKCSGTGEVNLKHGGRGRSLLGHISSCIGQAAFDLREGTHRLRRTEGNERARKHQRAHEEVENQQRVDAETGEELKQNREAIAEQFRRGMEVRKPRTRHG